MPLVRSSWFVKGSLFLLLAAVPHVSSIATGPRRVTPKAPPPPDTSAARLIGAVELLKGALGGTYDCAADKKKGVMGAVDWLLAVRPSYATRSFVELALSGDWRLEETSSKPADEAAAAARDLEIVDVVQSVELGRGRGSLVNAIAWRRPAAGDSGVFRASCDVEMTASVNRLDTFTLSFLTPTKHSLHPRGKLASDAVEVVAAIAHLAPFEVFDPEGTMPDLEFVDPELRIMGVALGSKRGSNSLHVFRRLDEGGFLDDE